MFKFFFFLHLFTFSSIFFANCFHYAFYPTTTETEVDWQESEIHSFDEIIISWNGERPTQGFWKISVETPQNQWKPYMEWGSSQQKSLDIVAQDTISLPLDTPSNQFRVRIEALEGATLEKLFSIHASTMNHSKRAFNSTFSLENSILLPVPQISQMAVMSPISMRICSPVSTLSVVSYLLGKTPTDPITFANKAYDQSCNIYGNWVLNIAQASSFLSPKFQCWTEKLTSFQQVVNSLQKGIPVIVSVKGPLEGSAQFYKEGHLLVIRGLDPKEKRVFVMDPAFPTDEETYTSYNFEDFLVAWSRRDYVAYLFEK